MTRALMVAAATVFSHMRPVRLFVGEQSKCPPPGDNRCSRWSARSVWGCRREVGKKGVPPEQRLRWRLLPKMRGRRFSNEAETLLRLSCGSVTRAGGLHLRR